MLDSVLSEPDGERDASHSFNLAQRNCNLNQDDDDARFEKECRFMASSEGAPSETSFHIPTTLLPEMAASNNNSVYEECPLDENRNNYNDKYYDDNYYEDNFYEDNYDDDNNGHVERKNVSNNFHFARKSPTWNASRGGNRIGIGLFVQFTIV